MPRLPKQDFINDHIRIDIIFDMIVPYNDSIVSICVRDGEGANGTIRYIVLPGSDLHLLNGATRATFAVSFVSAFLPMGQCLLPYQL